MVIVRDLVSVRVRLPFRVSISVRVRHMHT